MKRFMSRALPLGAVSPWERSFLDFLNLSFLICEVGVNNSPSQGGARIK